jgi:hypothetical protein
MPIQQHSFLYSILLLSAPLQQCLAQQPPGYEKVGETSLKRLVHYWADFKCISLSDNSEQSPKEQCKKACFPKGVISNVPAGQFVQHSQTCVLDPSQEADYRTGKPLTDEEKKQKPRKREKRFIELVCSL